MGGWGKIWVEAGIWGFEQKLSWEIGFRSPPPLRLEPST